MSKSRLEKFLYALYSIDSSDLPNPLSRIEELYKCLVTGEEVPSFKPTSRVEKYLMAILGGYDVDSLPNPLSRVEVLLYKLATGDDNLDDVKSFLSEHEELLAEIIRNGGVGGNIDIEYVLYTLSTEFNTLYNTAEKPVKSAILKGQTLVNLSKVSSHDFAQGRTPIYDLAQPMKANTTYTIFINVTLTGRLGIFIRFGKNAEGGYTQYRDLPNVGLYKFTVTPDMEYTQFAPYIQLSDYNAGIYGKYDNLVIIEGDYTNQDIPYFEGIQSVKMPVLTTTGKNMFDINGEKKVNGTEFSWEIKGNKLIVSGNGINGTVHKWNNIGILIDGLIVGDWYTLSYEAISDTENAYSLVSIYCPDGSSYGNVNGLGNKEISFSPSQSSIIVRFFATTASNANFNQTVTFSNFQLEQGSKATSYEPYKSNILSTPEDLELRGIGDVKDTLDVATGTLTQRIGEVILDGSDDEKWTLSESQNGENTYLTYIRVSDAIPSQGSFTVIDKLPYIQLSGDLWSTLTDVETYRINHNSDLLIRWNKARFSKAINSTRDFKEYLQGNPITVQYALNESIVKTVDLSVVDQDGDNTKLSTFNDITHVTLSSEGLIPEAELEVATKNEEVLNTMSLEMDDIYAAQTTLEETSNTQSENVDATMIATTEIYEGLL